MPDPSWAFGRRETGVPMADSRSWLAELKRVADGLSLSRFSLGTDDQACKESGLVGYRQSSSSKGNRNDRIVASSR